uniref:VirB7-like protein n=1 Tax=Moraxella bovis TaxID=476 RepID=Q5KT88_MORBO|nr:VirB7-like protein [Moraxella bovis Epp63]
MAFCALTLTACQSVHKPPMPKGAWVAVNQTVLYRQILPNIVMMLAH